MRPGRDGRHGGAANELSRTWNISWGEDPGAPRSRFKSTSPHEGADRGKMGSSGKHYARWMCEIKNEEPRFFGCFAKSPSPALESVKSLHFPPDLLWRISTTQRLIMPRIIEFPTLVQGDERGRNSILQFPRSPARAECVAQAETERGVPGWVAPGDCSPGGRVRR